MGHGTTNQPKRTTNNRFISSITFLLLTLVFVYSIQLGHRCNRYVTIYYIQAYNSHNFNVVIFKYVNRFFTIHYLVNYTVH